MECNREEAMRAKSIAEAKLAQRDLMGAKKFALKAQSLFPELDGVPQLLAMIDVYIAAENRVSGEMDWYRVLGVTPSADEDVIRKEYRKLALMLHPDKYRSVGADGAFQLISQAWSLLSDKRLRLAYNQRRSSGGYQLNVPVHTAGPSPPIRKNAVEVPLTPTPTLSCKRLDTFWTICHHCMIQFEYPMTYRNDTLPCYNCNKAFVASETVPPFSSVDFSDQVARQRAQASSNHVPSGSAYYPGKNVAAAQKAEFDGDSFGSANYRQVPIPDTTNGVCKDPSITTKDASVVQQAQDKSKRSCAESNTSAWKEYMKKTKSGDYSSEYSLNKNMAKGSGGLGSVSTSAPNSRIRDSSGPSQPNSTRGLTALETRNMMIEMARTQIQDKLREWNYKAPAACKEDTSRGQVINAANEDDTSAASMDVPDPDFHDFDRDRTASSFGDKEVWAAYDNVDGMPRFYALVGKVSSRKPFKLRIGWLNSKTNSEFSTTVDWVGSGFSKTCGEFRVGRYEECRSINSFSHKVNSSRGPRGSVIIVPQKGDVWALYKNWSSDWDELTPDEVVHKYEMVRIHDDYTEENGISVAPLVKVVGFKAVFRLNSDPGVIKQIPKEEMFRFSHRAPHYMLTGQEAPNAPEGCVELDPAAVPVELLQVITEANETPEVPLGENVDTELVQTSVACGSLDEIGHGTNDIQPANIAESRGKIE